MAGAAAAVSAPRPIADLAAGLGLRPEEWQPCGWDVAKLDPAILAGLRGRPRDFDVTVRSIRIQAGAGFLVALTGDIRRMPGLPRRPLAEAIDLRDGAIVGLRALRR